jgi:hypothetical protein
MFQYRTSDFAPSVTAIQKRLGAVEKELEKIGRIAGRRFRKGGQAASDQAGRLGNQALELGAKYGSDALQRLAGEAEQRPLLMIGVALGIGILIGAAVLGSTSGGGSGRRRR